MVFWYVGVTYPAPLHLSGQHDHHRGALLPGHPPEVRAGVGQWALARYVAVYQAGRRNLHLHKGKHHAAGNVRKNVNVLLYHR